MKPEIKSKILLGSTRSKSKMNEYNVLKEYHIKLSNDPHRLFPLCIGILGDFAEIINDKRFNYAFTQEKIDDLLFSTHFLEAFFLSKINPDLDNYLKTFIASAYYFSSLPGSSLVFSKDLTIDFKNYPTLSFLNTILNPSLNLEMDDYEKITDRKIGVVLTRFQNFIRTGEEKIKVESLTKDILDEAYLNASSLGLLIINLASAVIKLKLNNSVWNVLPESTGVSRENWSEVLRKENFIKELWPAQQILAKSGVFNGVSATIQMPTSAGKTKSIEIILRSYFFKNNSQASVIVAPFKALCHEIGDYLQECFDGEEIRVNEFTDVFQKDYSEQEEKGNQIIITTPEKLVYILRQDPTLSDSIGLLILDEGHQFDSGIRGVTYELLITSLKQMLPLSTQWILISAVLSNADAINSWLNGEEGEVVSGATLSPTQKTIGFVNWSKVRGQVQYVNNPNINKEDFFVPRVIDSTKLNRLPRERKDRFFPEKSDGSSIALHLGLKLYHNGCIALFCGQKTSVLTACNKLVELQDREYEISFSEKMLNSDELLKLSNLYFRHLGEDSPEGLSAKLGVLTHHASLPHGIRLSVEYALRKQMARFVICTSTLAQGVNLPIRYLIFTNIYQAGKKLSVRDFHNLVGRAGRAGMHTEGTILFANPEVYEKRNSRTEKWRWNLIEKILKPENSEPCTSSLLSIFDKIENSARGRDRRFELEEPTINFLKKMVIDPTYKEKLKKEITSSPSVNGFDEKTVSWQLNYKEKIINSIEGYLLSHLPEGGGEEERIHFVKKLTKDTLAYTLGNEKQRKWLIELFETIASSLIDKVPDSEKRTLYSKTLIGINEIALIDEWLDNNIDLLFENYEDNEGLLRCLWKLIYRLFPEDSSIKKLSNKNVPEEIAVEWVLGWTYHEILMERMKSKTRLKVGARNLTIQHIVDICEGELAFDGMLILGAVIELVESREGLIDTLIPDSLKRLQKSVKYGLFSNVQIRLFERGLSDREVAMDIGNIFIDNDQKVNNTNILKYSDDIEDQLKVFPSYFNYQFRLIKENIENSQP